jgi:predicted nucleotidyltransferase
MERDHVLDRIVNELMVERGAHTILLYGSRADGSANACSDYDLAAFAPVPRTLRDTRVIEGCFLDVFVHPEELLERPSKELLTLRGSRVLCERNGEAKRFLDALQQIYERGPDFLPDDEIRARNVWARKMALRARRGDPEGNYRRAWLLTALLEDYFATRGMWFEGPKKAFQWLRMHDVESWRAFGAALEPGAPLAAIDHLVERIAGPVSGDIP